MRAASGTARTRAWRATTWSPCSAHWMIRSSRRHRCCGSTRCWSRSERRARGGACARGHRRALGRCCTRSTFSPRAATGSRQAWDRTAPCSSGSRCSCAAPTWPPPSPSSCSSHACGTTGTTSAGAHPSGSARACTLSRSWWLRCGASSRSPWARRLACCVRTSAGHGCQPSTASCCWCATLRTSTPCLATSFSASSHCGASRSSRPGLRTSSLRSSRHAGRRGGGAGSTPPGNA
mmetsp:Transcript_4500/g.15137  ORF Transcript_4500/g.15137 Transcript_4500/m.15137 type:complete len:235 (+) Transcript_4500:1359-2063(+)